MGLGPIAPATSFYFTVSFSLTHAAALASLIQAQETPGSPSYRHFLTQQQFDQQFGPSPALDTEATTYFTSFGMTSVPTGSPLTLAFRAPASAVEAAFHSPIDLYRTVDGSVQYTNSQPLALPAPLAGFLSSISGVSSFPVMHAALLSEKGNDAAGFAASGLHPTIPAASTGNLSQVANWSTPGYLYAPANTIGAPTPIQFLNPATMTAAYNATGLYSLGDLGQGSTIAIVMAEGYNPSDLATFSNQTFGNPNQLLNRLSAYPVAGAAANGSAPGSVFQTGGDSGEFAIDLEYSSTMAPLAHIDAVYGPALDSASLVSSYAMIASLNPLPNVVTNSYGGSEDTGWNLMGPSWQGEGGIENAVEELASMGSTVLFSSADNAGYDSFTGDLSASFPASSPYVTSIGGTRTTVGNATMDAFPAPDYTINTTLADFGDSQAASGGLWYPNVTVDGVNAATVANESYWYTPTSAGAPPYAGGGIGLSDWFLQPWWQHGFTVSDSGRRMTADISAEADFNESYYFAGAWNFFWGGTSFSCPTVAGEIALIDTYLNSTLGPTPGQSSFYNGVIDPLLYDIANDQNLTNGPYNQITWGSNPYAVTSSAAGFGWPGGQNWPDAATGVTTGWNLLTGWGVPNVGTLATDAATILGQPYYVAFANGSAALSAPNATYTLTVQTTGLFHFPAPNVPYELWFAPAGLSMGAPVETTGTTSFSGTFSFTAPTPGFLEIYVQTLAGDIFQSTWFSPDPLTGGTLSISLSAGTPSSIMGGFDAFSTLYTSAYPYEYPAAGPDVPSSAIVQVTYRASLDGPIAPVYDAVVLGQTNFAGYWDSPPVIGNPEFNLGLLPPSTYTSLTLTNLTGVSFVPTWNVPVTETYWINATYLGLSASMSLNVTPRANVEGVGPIETLVAGEYAGAPGYLGYSGNNTVLAPAVTGAATYTLPVAFTNWLGGPLVGATVDLAYPPFFGPPFPTTPIPGTQATTNATGIAEFTINAGLSSLDTAFGLLCIQVFNASYAAGSVDSAIGPMPIWTNDSTGLLLLFAPAASISTTIFADGTPSTFVGTQNASAQFSVATPMGLFLAQNNISAMSYALDAAAPTAVPLGYVGQTSYTWSVSFPTLSVGEHNLSVWFTDSQGLSFMSVQPFWAIGAGSLPAPTVALTAPTSLGYVAGDVTVSWTVDEIAYLASESLVVSIGSFSATYDVTGLESWSVPTANLAAGMMNLTVTAVNLLGLSGSTTTSVWVDNVGPSASITSPAVGQSFLAGTNVTVGLAWAGDYLTTETLIVQAPTGSPQSVPLTGPSYTIKDVVKGTYKLTLSVASASGATGTAVASFAVVAPLSVGTPTSSRSSVDLGQAVTFSETATGGSGGNAYAWSGLPTGCAGTSASVTCTPSVLGAYSVSVTVTDSNGYGVASVALPFLVYAAPTVSSFAASPGTVTTGDTTILTVAVSGGGGPRDYSYVGLPAGCGSADTPTLTCTPTASGTYTVEVTVSDENGGSSQANATLTVNSASATVASTTAYGFLAGGLILGIILGAIAVAIMRPRRPEPTAPPAWQEKASTSEDTTPTGAKGPGSP